jgi:transposase
LGDCFNPRRSRARDPVLSPGPRILEVIMTPSRDNFPSPCPRSSHVPLQVTHPHAAGIDMGAAEHWVAVSPDGTAQAVRRFGAFTVDLEAIAAWLQACGVTTVAMESTGVYWIPLFELLESRGFQVLRVDPRQVQHAPGRPKSDAHDCQWLQRLHTYGLLAGAFRPEDQVGVLRGYLRQRQMLTRMRASTSSTCRRPSNC